jgi:hypothetical protein
MFHIISDLNLNYMDHADEQHLLPDHAKYIVITGNISNQSKRTLLYAERLAATYTNSNIILNCGITESYKGEIDLIEEGFDIYLNKNKINNENLYFPKGQIIGDYDFFCTIGWPDISSTAGFEDSYFSKYLYAAFDQSIYIDGILMSDRYPRFFDINEVQIRFEKEQQHVKTWLDTDQGKTKILITSLGNLSRQYLGKTTCKFFTSLNLSNVVWICGGDKELINSKIITSPGRDRSKLIDLNVYL